MFKKNITHNQKKLISFLKNLPPKVRKIINSSWASPFYEHIFCNIDESKFKDMYSDKYSRPNKPVNILVSLEIIKHLFNYTDEELIESFHTDLRAMYALGLEDPGEVCLAPRTLYYFREHLVKYDEKHNTSLLKEVLKDISLDLTKEFNLDLSLQRMDSSMIAANIKRLTRLNLFVKIIHNFLKILNSTDICSLPEEVQLLLKEKNLDLSHRLKQNETKEMLRRLGEYAYLLYEKYKNNSSYNKTKQFKNLNRLIDEQLNITGGSSPKVDLKPPKEVSSSSIQSPSDPDATYRYKDGHHKGYVGNFGETCSKDNLFQVITEVEVKPNNTPDTELLLESLNDENSLIDKANDLLTDGGYSGENTEDKCKQFGINLHVSAIKSPEKVKNNQNLADAIIEDGVLKECPAGKKPYQQKYDAKRRYLSGRFKKEDCSNCPFLSQCFVKERKKFYSYYFKEREYYVKIKGKQLEDTEYKEFLKLRAGAESMVYMFFYKSVKRTIFRGLSRVKNGIICRAIGINLLRLCKYIKDKGDIKEINALSSSFSKYIAQKWHFLLKYFYNLRKILQEGFFHLKYELFAF
jgi:hypothetical protein